MNKSDIFVLRDGSPGDRNFILASWLRGAYFGDSWFNQIPKDIFMTNYHKVITNKLSEPTTKIKVACLKDDPDVILGYMVYRQPQDIAVVDWVFVKSAWRKIGIAKALLPEKVYAVTHLTKLGKILKPASWIFNPFLF